MSTPSRVEVAPERLAGWLGRFASAHGDVSWSVDRETSPSSWLAAAADGSWARLSTWRDPEDVPAGPGGQGGQGEALGEWAAPPALLLVLVRRGGYAVGVASPAGELVAHKVGTRHVQSRTAAGGWSQQRFARRRANQADALVEAVVGHASRVLEEGRAVLGEVGGLVLGGDRALSAEVLDAVASGPRSRLHAIPRRELPDLPDPRRAVLDEAVRRGRAVRVTVSNA
ncbi:acVLRF1 family peptidyl-tRNA hydrolase [Ornithinimicrobium cerasi]|uniref:acVLRF1 family peptidyl-tRNA hydrolase n=1 Tax=Ornithinimicrobium cerasi TaxID=2248773 RepID=UPI000F002E31|nr:acVLRF1 family peptidyl-tRNA hydrolase [Ornithinimicrobium cerasi]